MATNCSTVDLDKVNNRNKDVTKLLALHAQFRSVLSLLCVVSAINHKGNPTLNPGGRIYRGDFEAVNDSDHDVTLLLDAAAAILVRESEVIAVTASFEEAGVGMVAMQSLVQQSEVEQSQVESQVEQSPVKQSLVEQPPVEHPPVEQSQVESQVEQSPVKQSLVEQPPVEHPPVEHPPVEQPPVEQSLVQQSAVEQSPDMLLLDELDPVGDMLDIDCVNIKGITAITNSKTKNYSVDNTDSFSYKLYVDEGDSYWEQLKGKGIDECWEECLQLKLKRNSYLSNHIATISGYLASISNNYNSDSYFTILQYIISSSWRKMERRISHWSSVGFYCVLRGPSFAEGSIVQTMSNVRLPYCERKDSSLSAVLNNPSVQQILPEIMNAYFTWSPVTQVVLFENLIKKLARHEPNNYTKETCIDFHRLLVGTLCLYRKNFEDMKASSRSATTNNKQTNYLEWTRVLGTLLYEIAYSKMLTSHLQVMVRSGLLSLPTSDSYGAYLQRLKDEDKNRSREVQGVGNPIAENQEQDAAGPEDEPEEESIELEQLLHDTRQGIVLAFKRWIRLQVVHWAALQILISAARKKTAVNKNVNLKISLITMDVGYAKMSPWIECLRKLEFHPSQMKAIRFKYSSVLKAGHEDADDMVFLEQLIYSMVQKHVENGYGTSRDIVRKFNRNSPDYALNPDSVGCGAVHCEAALASAIQYSNVAVPDKGSTRDLIQSFTANPLAVSKLCCPVCWELLKILRDHADPPRESIGVRGCHTSLFPVELPPWLPEDILQTMLSTFSDFLKVELKNFLENLQDKNWTDPQTKGRRSSAASLALSISSDYSSPSVEHSSAFKLSESLRSQILHEKTK